MISDAIQHNTLDFETISNKIAKDTNNSPHEINNNILENIEITYETYNYYLKN